MEMTPQNAQGTGQGPLEFPRYFTRAGRDPLTLVQFETRLVEGSEMKAPSPWSPESCAMLAGAAGPEGAHDWLLEQGRAMAALAAEQGLLSSASQDGFADEAALMLAKGMGWLGEQGGSHVGVLNLLRFCEPVTCVFDLAGLRQAVRLMATAAAARACAAGTPHSFSVGWTNLAGMFLGSSISYDSSRGVGIGGNLAAMILGEASLQSSRLAQARPDVLSPSHQELVLAGLKQARQAIENLPPTSSTAPPNPEPNRWLMEAASTLDAAVLGVTSFGILGPVPVSPTLPADALKWLDPLALGAEAVRTLQLSNLATRPEIKSALRALGLSESQKPPVLLALESGANLIEAGVPAEKAPSLRTATGSWSFHPNAQLQMAAAAAPFVAGVLAHRVHLPAGVPPEFSDAVLATAGRLGLNGVVLATGDDAAVSEPEADAALPEAAEEAVVSPEPDQAPVLEDMGQPGEASAAADAPAEPVMEEPIQQPGWELAAAGTAGAALAGAALAASRTTEAAEDVAAEVPTTPEAPPVQPEAEVAEESAPEPEQPLEETAQPDAGETSAAAEMQETEQQEAEQQEAEQPAAELPEAEEPAAEPSAAEHPEQASEASSDLGADAQIKPAAAQPSLEVRDARSIRTESDGQKVLIHILASPEGRPMEVAATAYAASPAERTLLDSFCQALSVGLASGVPLSAFANEITQPSLVRDVLAALVQAYPEQPAP